MKKVIVWRFAFAAALVASTVVAFVIAGDGQLTNSLSAVLWVGAVILIGEEFFVGIRSTSQKSERSALQQRRRAVGYSFVLLLTTALLILKALYDA
ncbi:hypothetical protein L2091_13385 [Curtobacterium albidum]|uniref:hypothetical protein n=1 Tax=Curtobacterium citreum TaxID=2036 RepID=UPI0020265615|nr:hypothetical protein [Curtobacterium albidum]MCL9666218.1 hypothetical protein [Curtobacterium albidum]